MTAPNDLLSADLLQDPTVSYTGKVSKTQPTAWAQEAKGKELVPICVAHGDGIGPDIMRATLEILNAAGARIAPQVIEIGEQIYKSGHNSGIEPSSWDALRSTKVFLKAPITTPVGKGYKSLNVTIRKTLGLYANVRPCVSYAPFVAGSPAKMDVVIIRENEEDLYAGIEHRHTDQVVQCLKLITRPGCERIVRYAFEYAIANGRKKVTCMVKDNIMKMTDGLFYSVFEEIGAQYPTIEKERYIIDIGAARVATKPHLFDVIVTTNLYGDILSDIAAEVSGSVGLAGSSNIGDHIAMFEAIHGSAPDIAGKDMANPSGLLLSAVMMLNHIGQPEVAQRIHNAWLRTIEDGVHTGDIASSNSTLVGTRAFTNAVIERLGLEPQKFAAVQYVADKQQPKVSHVQHAPVHKPKTEVKTLAGVDIFVQTTVSPNALADVLRKQQSDELQLQLITNRGVKVWPDGFEQTLCTDHWRCRFYGTSKDEVVSPQEIIALQQRLINQGVDLIKTENLYLFDGQRGFTLGQGQ